MALRLLFVPLRDSLAARERAPMLSTLNGGAMLAPAPYLADAGGFADRVRLRPR